ncbi:hypothetical protein L2E82_39556 [Cichorium intybus]|uniref:Uncharacterized protein n=1 Tax=Cichorium intybus TaxID=13427 RepID=A0ACB9AIL2_CICIN|nr:hypothetical protein L2E82_39556 [Cichorium intybus]
MASETESHVLRPTKLCCTAWSKNRSASSSSILVSTQGSFTISSLPFLLFVNPLSEPGVHYVTRVERIDWMNWNVYSESICVFAVRDEEGRTRFHGAFSGGFSAGYFNTVGSKEGCRSQWGHDFRPDYKNLGILKTQFPNATTTKKVQMDLVEMQNIPKCVKFVSTVNRSNLFYMVRQKSSIGKLVIDDIADFIQNSSSINKSEILAKELRERGVSADHYHAYMDVNAREKVHMRSSNSKLQVKNSLEESEVIGITNYIDFGFELLTRVDNQKPSNNIHDSTFNIAACWQANKNILL